MTKENNRRKKKLTIQEAIDILLLLLLFAVCVAVWLASVILVWQGIDQPIDYIIALGTPVIMYLCISSVVNKMGW